MKAGRVVYIRVSPKDCMSVIDACHKVSTITRGMSFAQLVSRALGTCLETLRHEGVIPTREGFEYNEMMKPWSGEERMNKLRYNLNRAIELQGSEFIEPPLPVGQADKDVVLSRNPRIARLERQLIEVKALQDADPDNDRSEEIESIVAQIAIEYAKEQRGET